MNVFYLVRRYDAMSQFFCEEEMEVLKHVLIRPDKTVVLQLLNELDVEENSVEAKNFLNHLINKVESLAEIDVQFLFQKYKNKSIDE